MKVFELSKELNLPTKELLKKTNLLGLEINNNFSELTDEQVKQLKESLTGKKIDTRVAGNSDSLKGIRKVRKRISLKEKADTEEEEITEPNDASKEGEEKEPIKLRKPKKTSVQQKEGEEAREEGKYSQESTNEQSKTASHTAKIEISSKL